MQDESRRNNGSAQGRVNGAAQIGRAKALANRLGGRWLEDKNRGREAQCPLCGRMEMSITPKPERDRILFFCNYCKKKGDKIVRALTKAGEGFFSPRRKEPTERELTEQAAQKMNEQGLSERARNVCRLVWWHVVMGGEPNGDAPITIKQFMAWLKTRSAWVAAKALDEAKAAGWLKVKIGSRGVGRGRATNHYGVSWLPQGYNGKPSTKPSTARPCTESVTESVTESNGKTESVGDNPLKFHEPDFGTYIPTGMVKYSVLESVPSSTSSPSSRRQRLDSLAAGETLRDRCKGQWPSILLQLGLRLTDAALRKRDVPCPMCGGKDRFRFRDDSVGLWYCRGCGHGDGFNLVMAWKGVSFHEAARLVEGLSPSGNCRNSLARTGVPLVPTELIETTPSTKLSPSVVGRPRGRLCGEYACGKEGECVRPDDCVLRRLADTMRS
jgi:hypothetical protein